MVQPNDTLQYYSYRLNLFVFCCYLAFSLPPKVSQLRHIFWNLHLSSETLLNPGNISTGFTLNCLSFALLTRYCIAIQYSSLNSYWRLSTTYKTNDPKHRVNHNCVFFPAGNYTQARTADIAPHTLSWHIRYKLAGHSETHGLCETGHLQLPCRIDILMVSL